MAKIKQLPMFVNRKKAAAIYGKERGTNGNVDTFNAAFTRRENELTKTSINNQSSGDYYIDFTGKYWFNPISIAAFARNETKAA